MWRSFRAILLIFSSITVPFAAEAGLIRDAEIEDTLARFSRPIFSAADITPESVRIFIVASPEINAYVAGGLNIFINTGLIRETKNADMLIGVIAHETGHIAGAHLSQSKEKASRALLGSIIGVAAGAAAAASGAGQAGAGIVLGSQSMVNRNLLSDMRLNEQAADHAALTYLDSLNISAAGMLEMFELLRGRESGGTARDKYLSNHPLSSERVATMRNHLSESHIPKGQVPEGYNAAHARMVAKLIAFTEPYETTLTLYPAKDGSVAARYARAIAEFKRSQFAPALSGMNGLIKQFPNDAYFYDTKGQILFESGDVEGASAAYAKAASLKPRSALITTEYAKTLIATDNPKALPQAIQLLEHARELDDSYDVTWRQLALAYGKQGKLGASYEALAEEAALDGDYESVLQHVARARGYAKDDPSLMVQLDDLQRDAKSQLEKRRDTLFQ